jgi:predicted enzyme related to lactoylglutathione lyase
MRNTMAVIALTSVVVLVLQGCADLHAAHSPQAAHGQEDPHAEGSHSDSQASGDLERTRPTNQVAVLTVWAEVDKLEETADFYEHVLGLQRKGTSTSPCILDTDGTFIAIMAGKLESPREPGRRWPMFALSVPDLDQSVQALREAKVELPWGVEEFGAPEPSSRYVMFRDPAGNLIEIVQWL